MSRAPWRENAWAMAYARLHLFAMPRISASLFSSSPGMVSAQFHGRATGLAASLRGVHKCEHFESLFVGKRRLLGFEKFHDFNQQRTVTVRRFRIALVDFVVGAEYDGAELPIRPKGA